jgi:hypothetical protein
MKKKEEDKQRLAQEEAEKREKEDFEKRKKEGYEKLAKMKVHLDAAKLADEFLKSKLDRRPACIDRSNEVLWGRRYAWG